MKTAFILISAICAIGCSSAGNRRTGDFDTAGAAGMNDGSGGNGASSGRTGTGGREGTGGGGTCIPKTCTQIALDLTHYDPASGSEIPKACGLVLDDGCGNAIDCGGCNDWQACGGNNIYPASDFSLSGVTESGAIPNICAGNCVFYNMIEPFCTLAGINTVTTEYLDCPYYTGHETTSPLTRIMTGIGILDESNSMGVELICSTGRNEFNCCALPS